MCQQCVCVSVWVNKNSRTFFVCDWYGIRLSDSWYYTVPYSLHWDCSLLLFISLLLVDVKHFFNFRRIVFISLLVYISFILGLFTEKLTVIIYCCCFVFSLQRCIHFFYAISVSAQDRNTLSRQQLLHSSTPPYTCTKSPLSFFISFIGLLLKHNNYSLIWITFKPYLWASPLVLISYFKLFKLYFTVLLFQILSKTCCIID